MPQLQLWKRVVRVGKGLTVPKSDGDPVRWDSLQPVTDFPINVKS